MKVHVVYAIDFTFARSSGTSTDPIRSTQFIHGGTTYDMYTSNELECGIQGGIKKKETRSSGLVHMVE